MISPLACVVSEERMPDWEWVRSDCQEQGDGGEGQREKIQNGQKGHKRFEGEGVAECNIGKGGLDCTVEVYMSEESEERVTVLRVGTQQGAALRLRAAKSSEFERESCEPRRWTHLEQVQHCTDLPRQVTFPAHTEQGKMGQGLDERYLSLREGEE